MSWPRNRMVLRRRKHKLPKFPADIRDTFFRLCETLSVDNIESYRNEIKEVVQEQQKEAKTNRYINLELIDALQRACNKLLDIYPNLNPKHQALAIGAIRYFALSEDPFSDQHFASGMDDDAKVMNHVLEELGVEDMFIDLP